jgi:hypothetical protein
LRDHFLGGAMNENAVQTQLPLLLRLGVLSKADVAFVLQRSLAARERKDGHVSRLLRRVHGLAAAKRPSDGRKREVYLPIAITGDNAQWVGVVGSGSGHYGHSTLYLFRFPIGGIGVESTLSYRRVLGDPVNSSRMSRIAKELTRRLRGPVSVKVLQGVQSERTLALFEKLRTQKGERKREDLAEAFRTWWHTTQT